MQVSDQEFEQIAADAMDALPSRLFELLENIAVIVQDEPTPEQCATGGDLLGLYEGRGYSGPGPLLPGYMAGPVAMPDRILLFRNALCAVSNDEEELFRNVYETLVHEFAHHFGIDDDRLDELGWA